MNRDIKIEVCAGGYADCVAAKQGGADRVELNGAFALGGLTPTVPVLKKVKHDTGLEVIAMVRPRAGGFCYDADEKEIMFTEAENLLENGADGLAFGFLNADGSVDLVNTRKMVELIHRHRGTAVFHRAIDVTPDIDAAIQMLMDLGVDRVLTSGQKAKALNGVDVIAELQKKYGDRIQILPGSGINAGNAAEILEKTGVNQLHASCRGYRPDPTTMGEDVSYAYLPAPHEGDYDVADEEAVCSLRRAADTAAAA
nr:copper homeostasis protein CutC [Faecalibaculum rodentium]